MGEYYAVNTLYDEVREDLNIVMSNAKTTVMVSLIIHFILNN